jgi:hypothetical protein
MLLIMPSNDDADFRRISRSDNFFGPQAVQHRLAQHDQAAQRISDLGAYVCQEFLLARSA